MLQHHVLIDEIAIHARVQELSQQIADDIGGKQPIVLGLLKGSSLMADRSGGMKAAIHYEREAD